MPFGGHAGFAGVPVLFAGVPVLFAGVGVFSPGGP
jgi:hypothetical protein